MHSTSWPLKSNSTPLSGFRLCAESGETQFIVGLGTSHALLFPNKSPCVMLTIHSRMNEVYTINLSENLDRFPPDRLDVSSFSWRRLQKTTSNSLLAVAVNLTFGAIPVVYGSCSTRWQWSAIFLATTLVSPDNTSLHHTACPRSKREAARPQLRHPRRNKYL